MKRLIREEEIKQAALKKKKILLNSETVITPSARDLAKELGVLFYDGNEIYEPSSALIRIIDNELPKKIAIASDHGGFYMKEDLKTFLREKNYMVNDLGPGNANSCDYPDYAFKVAEMVSEKKADCGIIIDSVGIGSAIAANKVNGILAAKCNNTTEAASVREHNYANVLTLGSMIIGINVAKEIVLTFLSTKGGAERHQKRIGKIINYENSKVK